MAWLDDLAKAIEKTTKDTTNDAVKVIDRILGWDQPKK